MTRVFINIFQSSSDNQISARPLPGDCQIPRKAGFVPPRFRGIAKSPGKSGSSRPASGGLLNPPESCPAPLPGGLPNPRKPGSSSPAPGGLPNSPESRVGGRQSSAIVSRTAQILEIGKSPGKSPRPAPGKPVRFRQIVKLPALLTGGVR